MLSRNRARCSDDWKRTDSHTSHASHTRQNRQKEGSQRTFARPRTLQELHRSAPSNNVQRRARRRGSNNQKDHKNGLPSHSHHNPIYFPRFFYYSLDSTRYYPTQRSSPKQAHWYMCRLTLSVQRSSPESSLVHAQSSHEVQCK